MADPFAAVRVEPVERLRDGRGELLKLMPGPVGGEVYAVRVRPGASRGHHLHRAMGEWFVALGGRGVLVLLDPAGGRTLPVELDGRRVFVPPGLAHAVFNTGEGELVVVALAGRVHDAADVFPLRVPPP